jgi:hypothetical protein
MASLRDHIMRARQAQQDNEQKHDVQLSAIPFTDAEIGNYTICWASEEEYRDAWHSRFDRAWEACIAEHYDFRS